MQILFQIAEKEDLSLKSYSRLDGGDINDVFLLETASGKMVIKLNNGKKLPNLFKEEAFALESLKKTHSFLIPEVLSFGKFQDKAYLILSYIETGTPSGLFWEKFAKNLVELHQTTASHFGWESTNYIGSLQQFNAQHDYASQFYIEERLEPQLKLADQNGFKFQDVELFYKEVEQQIPKQEKPALIHGDLWAGNYLCSSENVPVLIDPASCYASKEMDLAMMKLFGGYPEEVFSAYEELSQIDKQWTKRIKMYQLYYVLVHLNLFGSSYYHQAKNIVNSYL